MESVNAAPSAPALPRAIRDIVIVFGLTRFQRGGFRSCKLARQPV